MMCTRATTRRGLTLVELMMALLVTTFVAAAISGMMGAVTAGISTRQDTRSVMIRANAAQNRLSAYVVPSRCILAAAAESMTIWFNDSRESDTVHATEIRWLTFDSKTGGIDVSYVEFPGTWTQAAKDLADNEYAKSTDWGAVYADYQSKGYIASLRLVDGLDTVAFSAFGDVSTARHVSFTLGFTTDAGPEQVQVSTTISEFASPVK